MKFVEWQFRCSVYALLVAVISAATSGPARAVSNFCPGGTCDIATPVYVNVYWSATWNADVAASSTPDMTTTRIDALTQSLINSAYFSGLQQYSVTSVSVLMPSIIEGNCGAPPSDLDAAHSQLGAFATCVVALNTSLNNGNTILNVFLPPQTAPIAGHDFCTKFAGEHDKYGSPVEVTFLPTNSSCNGSISTLLATMSHEMVEAATDPVPASPTGWKVFADGEVADQCQDMNAPGASFLFASVQSYFSNSLSSTLNTNGVKACTVGFSTAPPAIRSATVCGTGRSMQMHLTGSFGPMPWDLPGQQLPGLQTLYVTAAVSGSHAWEAGNYDGFPPDNVSFGSLTWTPGTNGAPDAIQINGFAPIPYGSSQPSGSLAVVSPGDTVTLTVFGTQNGQPVTQALTAPSAANVFSMSVIPVYGQPYFVGDPANVSGTLVDTGGCPVETAPITLSSTDGAGALAPNSFTVASAGFSSVFTPSTAGVKTVSVLTPVSASAQITVLPAVLDLSPAQGTTQGKQRVQLSGGGFVSGVTSVTVNGVAATNVSVLNATSLTFVTPPSTLPGSGEGTVSVIVTVSGAASSALDYEYIVPGQPYASFTVPCKGNDYVSESVYNADGSTDTEAITLSASTAAFVGPSGAYVMNLPATTGQDVSFLEGTTITATPSQNGTLGVSQTPPRRPITCSIGLLKSTVFWYPTSSVPYDPTVCRQCNQNTVIWNGEKNASDPGDYVAVSSTDPVATIQAGVTVSGLTTADITSYVRESPYVAVTSSGTASKVQFIGRAVSVSQKGRAPDVESSLNGTAIISFALPSRRAQRSDYGILHLEGSGPSSLWVEQSLISAEESGGSIRASVTKGGVYALALVRAQLLPQPARVIVPR